MSYKRCYINLLNNIYQTYWALICKAFLQQGYKSTMTFLKYFAAKEELLKNADESLRKRIRSLSTNGENDVKEENENDDDTHDDVI